MRRFAFILLFLPLVASASTTRLFNQMNDLLAEIGPTFPGRNLTEARDLVYACFLAGRPCVTDGYWAAGRTARLVGTEFFRANAEQRARAKVLEATYQKLAYTSNPNRQEYLLDKMNDLLGVWNNNLGRQRNLRDARGLVHQCFIQKRCLNTEDLGWFDNQRFVPTNKQVQEAKRLLNLYSENQ